MAIYNHGWGVKLGTTEKKSGWDLDRGHRNASPALLPLDQAACLKGRGRKGKKRRGRGREEKVFPFPLPLSSPPSPLPFCPCRAGYSCLYLSDLVPPPMNCLLLLSRTGFINRSVVAQLLSILWSPLFLKRWYIQWSILCPVNHPNKKKLLLHCMDSLMPRSCQCSLLISRYVLYFLLSQGSKIFNNNR